MMKSEKSETIDRSFPFRIDQSLDRRIKDLDTIKLKKAQKLSALSSAFRRTIRNTGSYRYKCTGT